MTNITASKFKLPEGIALPSKNTIIISGIEVHVYGLEELPGGSKLAILYLAHGRTRTYRNTEAILQYIVSRHNVHAEKTPLIGVTIDMRNHGARLIDADRQGGWPQNDTHGPDMLSDIWGSAQDFISIAQFLPAHIPQYSEFYQIMAGSSLGGHTTWRVANVGRDIFQAYAPIIGSPNISRLMIERLGVPLPEDLGKSGSPLGYDHIREHISLEQEQKWPRALADLIHRNDTELLQLDLSKAQYLILNGALDPLVPNKYSVEYLKTKNGGGSTVQLIAQENAGHQTTPEMVGHLENWLNKIIP